MFYEVTLDLIIPKVVRTIRGKQKVFKDILGSQTYYVMAKNEDKAQVGAEQILRSELPFT